MKTSRSYTQTARAEAAEASRVGILDAYMQLTMERASTGIPLAEIAERAGVTVQTILRKFGSRERLFEATIEHARSVIVHEREAPVGDAARALTVLVDHYESRGRSVLALLAEERTHPKIHLIVERGRTEHRDWVAAVFAPWLDRLDGTARAERARLLVVATDIYSWKLLRQDMRLTRAATERHLLQLVTALLSPIPPA